MLKLLANVISDLLDTWMCLKCLSICWYCRTILSIHLVFRPRASDLRHVLMFWWICQTWISSNSGCCPVARLQARTADKYWTTIEAGENCISHPLNERRLCVPGRRFGIYRFRIFIFPAVFSHPFIEEQLASFCPISPNALRSPLQCTIHCNVMNCPVWKRHL